VDPDIGSKMPPVTYSGHAMPDKAFPDDEEGFFVYVLNVFKRLCVNEDVLK
jgi:hypothetical protein